MSVLRPVDSVSEVGQAGEAVRTEGEGEEGATERDESGSEFMREGRR